MLSLVFKSKLKKLNPDLFVDDTQARVVNGEWKASMLCCNKFKRAKEMLPSEYAQLGDDARKWLQAKDGGWLPEYICGVPVGYVPEYDVFDENGRPLARGWRSICMVLATRGYTTLEKARRVFSSSLGERAYDRMTLDEKSEAARVKKQSARELLTSLNGASRSEIKNRIL